MSLFISIIAIIILIEVSYLVYRSGLSLRHESQRHPVFLDTSALMDGRIVTAAQTGFIPPYLVVPKSVINELQLLADQADAEKRSRARRGLDAIRELQESEGLTVEVMEDKPVGKDGVDGRLVELAQRYNGSICTIDFNLNKVATVQGIRVLNINELAGNIRMAFLPGETISLGLTQKGQSSSQAVGYLADGTMVVVDKAADKIGQTIEIEFIRSLQTAAGRMMFARPLEKQPSPRTDAEGRPQTKSRGSNSARGRASAQNEAESVQANDEKKPAGRRPQSGSRKPKGNDEAEGNKPQPRRRSSRRTKEDSLIELVNQQ